MVLSQSVVPPEATTPTKTSQSAEPQTLSPALLASTIARLNGERRQL
jgi:hypothetical protein